MAYVLPFRNEVLILLKFLKTWPKTAKAVIDCTEIEASAVLDACCRRGLIKDLDPQIELFADLSPYRHTCEPVVLVTGTWIDPVAAAAIDRPEAKVLLQ